MNITRALNIEGWMFEDELKFLAQQAASAHLTIEFGCYKGRSTRALADNTNGTVFAVDPWNGDYPSNDGGIHGIRTDVFDEFKKNLYDKITDETVIPFKTFSTDFYTSRIPDFIFIDGDHRYETVLKDIKLSQELMKKGGILAGHDYTHGDWPGVKKAVDEIFSKINQIDSIWWVYL